jgi:predicted DNA-binding protein (MmcQ/YjbR family)
MPLIFEGHFFITIMNVEDIREYALCFPNVTEGFPFGESVLVFKVNGKIFLLLPLDTLQIQCNVKCDPERAIELREEYPENILPGYHMNKKHWNTMILDGRISISKIKELITHSYELVSGKK